MNTFVAIVGPFKFVYLEEKRVVEGADKANVGCAKPFASFGCDGGSCLIGAGSWQVLTLAEIEDFVKAAVRAAFAVAWFLGLSLSPLNTGFERSLAILLI